MRRRPRRGRVIAAAVTALCALTGGCRGDDVPAVQPAARGMATPVRVATPSVPIYEGCYVSFDAATPATSAESPSTPLTGTLVLQLAADPAGMGPFRSIAVEVLDCAGANRGAVRDVGWARVPAAAGQTTLDVASGAAATVAEGPLPVGSWDRVFVAVPRSWGVQPDGQRVALETYVEPIARGFVMPPAGRVTVAMQLTTRARPAGWDGGWNLFTKDAWLIGDDALGP